MATEVNLRTPAAEPRRATATQDRRQQTVHPNPGRRSTDRVQISAEAREPQGPSGAAPAPAGTVSAQADWQRRQQAAVQRKYDMLGHSSDPNPETRNRYITQQYDQLSEELRDMLGRYAGANWSTWAAWASSRAGQTIRGEELQAVPGPMRGAGEWAGRGVGMDYEKTRDAVGDGNKKVFDEIAPQFARFIETFRGDTQWNQQKWDRFAAGFSPQQKRLREGFKAYYQAMFEKNVDKKQEFMLRGNIFIAWHEQARLDPEIDRAMGALKDKPCNAYAMQLGLPGEALNLGQDVPPLPHQPAFPESLRTLDDRRTRSLVDTFDDNLGSLRGSGASDWSDLNQRMRYIVDMFRTRHTDPTLFAYTPR